MKIDAIVTGSLPPSPSLMSAMISLRDRVRLDIIALTDGHAWQQVIYPPRLAQLNYIKRNLASSISPDYQTVNLWWTSAPHDLRVAFVHEYGAKIQISDKMRRYFLHKAIETQHPMWFAMLSKKKTEVTIPARSVIPTIMKYEKHYAEWLGRNLTTSATQKP